MLLQPRFDDDRPQLSESDAERTEQDINKGSARLLQVDARHGLYTLGHSDTLGSRAVGEHLDPSSPWFDGTLEFAPIEPNRPINRHSYAYAYLQRRYSQSKRVGGKSESEDALQAKANHAMSRRRAKKKGKKAIAKIEEDDSDTENSEGERREDGGGGVEGNSRSNEAEAAKSVLEVERTERRRRRRERREQREKEMAADGSSAYKPYVSMPHKPSRGRMPLEWIQQYDTTIHDKTEYRRHCHHALPMWGHLAHDRTQRRLHERGGDTGDEMKNKIVGPRLRGLYRAADNAAAQLTLAQDQHNNALDKLQRSVQHAAEPLLLAAASTAARPGAGEGMDFVLEPRASAGGGGPALGRKGSFWGTTAMLEAEAEAEIKRQANAQRKTVVQRKEGRAHDGFDALLKLQEDQAAKLQQQANERREVCLQEVKAQEVKRRQTSLFSATGPLPTGSAGMMAGPMLPHRPTSEDNGSEKAMPFSPRTTEWWGGGVGSDTASSMGVHGIKRHHEKRKEEGREREQEEQHRLRQSSTLQLAGNGMAAASTLPPRQFSPIADVHTEQASGMLQDWPIDEQAGNQQEMQVMDDRELQSRQLHSRELRSRQRTPRSPQSRPTVLLSLATIQTFSADEMEGMLDGEQLGTEIMPMVAVTATATASGLMLETSTNTNEAAALTSQSVNLPMATYRSAMARPASRDERGGAGGGKTNGQASNSSTFSGAHRMRSNMILQQKHQASWYGNNKNSVKEAAELHQKAVLGEERRRVEEAEAKSEALATARSEQQDMKRKEKAEEVRREQVQMLHEEVRRRKAERELREKELVGGVTKRRQTMIMRERDMAREEEERQRLESREKVRLVREGRIRREAEERARLEAETQAKNDTEKEAMQCREEDAKRRTEEEMRAAAIDKAKNEMAKAAAAHADSISAKVRWEVERRKLKEEEAKARAEEEQRWKEAEEEELRRMAEREGRRIAAEQAQKRMDKEAKARAAEVKKREEKEQERRRAAKKAKGDADEKAKEAAEEYQIREEEKKTFRKVQEQAREEAEAEETARATQEAEEAEWHEVARGAFEKSVSKLQALVRARAARLIIVKELARQQGRCLALPGTVQGRSGYYEMWYEQLQVAKITRFEVDESGAWIADGGPWTRKQWADQKEGDP
jgi:hypothetical protein